MQVSVLSPILSTVVSHSLQASQTLLWSLFAPSDLLYQGDKNTIFARVSFTESAVLGSGDTADSILPMCLFSIPHVPLALTSLQFSILCHSGAFKSIRLGWELVPELALRESNSDESNFFQKNKVRPAFSAGAKIAFSVKETRSSHVSLYGAFKMKFLFREKDNYFASFVKPQFSVYALQKWADVFDSGLNSGVVWNIELNETVGQTAVQLDYFEALPLALRRVGALQDTAALSFKKMDFSYRRSWYFSNNKTALSKSINVRSSSNSGEEDVNKRKELIVGAGIGYGILTFDSLRISSPLPSFYLGFGF